MIQYIGQDGRTHTLGDNELAHYNHNHDKLGRFASSSGSARSAQRSLRKLETHRVKTLGREMKADYKFRKAYQKANSNLDKTAAYSMKKNANPKRIDRLKKKTFKSMDETTKYKDKANTYEKNRHETEKFINKAISNAEKNGYKVSSKATVRSSQRGKDFVNAYLGAEIAGLVGAYVAISAKNKKQQKKYGPYYEKQTPSRIASNKYNVKKPRQSRR